MLSPNLNISLHILCSFYVFPYSISYSSITYANDLFSTACLSVRQGFFCLDHCSPPTSGQPRFTFPVCIVAVALEFLHSLVLLTCLICNNYCNRSGDCQDRNWVLALSVPVCHYFIVAWIFFCSGTSYDLLLTGDCACFSLCVCVCVTVRENYEFMPKGLWLFAFVCMSSLVFLVTPAFLC